MEVPSDSLLFKINNHVFCIQTLFTKDGMEAYAAIEVYKKNGNKDSNYRFEVFGSVDSKQALIFELISKTIDGVINKSIECESKYNIVSIKQIGQMILENNEDDESEYG